MNTDPKDYRVPYKTLRKLTVPTLSMKAAGEYLLKFISPIIQKPDRNNPEKPLYVARAIDLTTGEMGEVVLGKMLWDILTENYPDNTHAGRSFRIVKKPSGKGKAGQNEYNLFYVDEIETEVIQPPVPRSEPGAGGAEGGGAAEEPVARIGKKG